MESFEHKKLFETISRYRFCSLYLRLDIDMTKLFLELLEQKDKELLTVLEEIFRRGSEIKIFITFPAENNKYSESEDLFIYLAKNNKIAEFKTLFDCRMNASACSNDKRCAILINTITNNSIELFRLLENAGMLLRVTQYSLLNLAVKYNGLKMIQYFMKQWDTIDSEYIDYWSMVSLNQHKNDIAFCMVLPYFKPEITHQYCEYLKNGNKTEMAEKIERWSEGLTLHQRCIIAVKCSDIKIPEWFPSVLLDFSMC